MNIPVLISHYCINYCSLTSLKVLNSIVLLGKCCEYLKESKATSKTDYSSPRTESMTPKRSRSKEDLPTYAYDKGEPENLSCLDIKRSQSLVINHPPILKIGSQNIRINSPSSGIYMYKLYVNQEIIIRYSGVVVVIDLPLLRVAVEGSDNPVSLEKPCQASLPPDQQGRHSLGRHPEVQYVA